jgi:hypothetical protein
MLFLLELLKAYMCFWATGTLLQEIYFLNPQLLGTYALLPPPLKGGRRHHGVSPFYKNNNDDDNKKNHDDNVFCWEPGLFAVISTWTAMKMELVKILDRNCLCIFDCVHHLLANFSNFFPWG